MRDLNFNSKYSYVNGNIAVDGNILSCNSIEELRKELTENEGFYPIGDESYYFQGTFNGNNNKIINIYINRTINNVGLFGAIDGALIKNMSISGNITSTGDNVGGIVGCTRLDSYYSISSILENCTNNCYVKGNAYVGGLLGWGQANVRKCLNISSIIGKTHVGGIVGNSNFGTIQFCYNNASINANQYVGGIAGMKSSVSKIFNCYNIGQIIRK